MKIRTDFVTNSSSSSFSVIVSIYDKSGKEYSIEDDPYDYSPDEGGSAWFDGELASALSSDQYRYLRKLKDQYSLNEVDEEGRNERIESVKVGDPVTLHLVKLKPEKEMEQNYYYLPEEYGYIDVRNEEGSLGILPKGLAGTLYRFLDNEKVSFTTTVTECVPLSKRNKNAKKALISVHIDVEINDSSFLRFSDIGELCRFLTESIEDDYHDWDEDYEDWDEGDEDEVDEEENHDLVMKKRKQKFTEEVINNVKALENISKIVVRRDFYGSGEGSILIADNDDVLCELAKKVRESSGTERNQAKAELLEYINTPNGNRGQYDFGDGFEDFIYVWAYGPDTPEKIDKHLEELVERLGTNHGPSSTEGSEYYEINMETGEYTKYAKFVLE